MAANEIVIVGAGIGGLTAALALSKPDRAITLLERRTGFAELGAGIQLSPNASRVLIGLGLGPALRRAATEPPGVVVRALRSGRTIGEVALGAFAEGQFGAPYYVIHRADLQTLLLDAARARPNVRMLLGRTVIAAASGADRAQVTIEKAGGATETLRGDLVVGTDGLWSTVRRALGDARAPIYRGYTAWRATIPREAAPAALAGDATGLWLGREGHVVHYPIGRGRLLNIVAIEPRAEPVDGWSAPGNRDELLSAFARAAPPLRELLHVAEKWLLWSLFDLPAARMAQGRIALLGDAAHPVLPFLAQGGALAIEDAAVLAKALGGDPDVTTALKRYEAARLARAARVQRAALRSGRTYHAGGVKALIRDAVMRGLGPEGMTRRYAWLYGWRGG